MSNTLMHASSFDLRTASLAFDRRNGFVGHVSTLVSSSNRRFVDSTDGGREKTRERQQNERFSATVSPPTDLEGHDSDQCNEVTT